MLARSYEDGEQVRSRTLPQTPADSGEVVGVDLDRSTALPSAAQIGERTVAFGPEIEGPEPPEAPRSTIEVERAPTGATVGVAAAVDGGEVERIEWRDSVDAAWTAEDGSQLELDLPGGGEHVWVRAVSAAGVTETPAQRVRVGPDTDADPCAQVPGTTFGDADRIADVHRPNVQCLAGFGITLGVDDVPNFAPHASVNRQQMATFIARLLRQATTGDTAIPDDVALTFDDVASSNVHAPAIAWLAEIGVTAGTDPQSFSPTRPVTRQQMASFIARAQRHLELYGEDDLESIVAAASRTPFTDLHQVSQVHQPNIELLQALGVVEGRADGGFGPHRPVTRQQMAAFIVRSAVLLDEYGRWKGQPVGNG